MSRPALLALFALLVGGCRPAADAEPVGSPGDSVAGTETKRGLGSTGDGSGASAGRAKRSALATTLVAVASTGAGEAQPCERVCGSLGDCLLADADYTTAAAGGLELQCLDLCVHAPETSPAKSEFLACGGQTECGSLQACAERTWTALAEVRQGPAVAGVVGPGGDLCKQGCRWYWACTVTGMPPGEAYVPPEVAQYVDDCVEACDQHYSQSDRDNFAKLAACLPNHCSGEQMWECFSG